MPRRAILNETVGGAFSLEPCTEPDHAPAYSRAGTGSREEHTYHLRVWSAETAKLLEALVRGLEPLVRERSSKVRERKLEELIEFFTSKLVVPSEVDVRMAERLAQRRAHLLKEFGYVTAEQLAKTNASKAENRHALADNWKKRHLVFSVIHRDSRGRLREVFPAFQFEDDRPIKAVREIIEAFGARKSPWKLAMWFTSNNGWLPKQTRPVDLLASDPRAVIEAARLDAGGSAA